MKKIISVLVIVMVFMLAGCEDESSEDYTRDRCGENGEWVSTTLMPSNDGYCKYESYYTQEEVDEMLEGYQKVVFLDSIDDMCQLITSSGFRDADDCRDVISWLIDNWEEIEDWNFDFKDDYVTKTYLWADFYDSFGEDIVEYMEETYQPLEDYEIDNQITITTIAQIDLVLYGLEHSQEPLTDEEQFVFDLYTQLREQLYLEIGGE